MVSDAAKSKGEDTELASMLFNLCRALASSFAMIFKPLAFPKS